MSRADRASARGRRSRSSRRLFASRRRSTRGCRPVRMRLRSAAGNETLVRRVRRGTHLEEGQDGQVVEGHAFPVRVLGAVLAEPVQRSAAVPLQVPAQGPVLVDDGGDLVDARGLDQLGERVAEVVRDAVAGVSVAWRPRRGVNSAVSSDVGATRGRTDPSKTPKQATWRLFSCPGGSSPSKPSRVWGVHPVPRRSSTTFHFSEDCGTAREQTA